MIDLGFLTSTTAWLTALLIFGMRVSDMTLDTIRVIFVIRGRKWQAWVLGFINSLIFVVAITKVLSNLNNPLSYLGYAAGFATGNVLGMLIEQKMAIGHTRLTVISSLGKMISQELRKNGFAVTEISAQGRDGCVEVLNCSITRNNRAVVERIILNADPNAFITAEDVNYIQRGFFRSKVGNPT